MITQELLKKHLFYYEGHLWWVIPTAPNVEIGQIFGCLDSDGYRHGNFYGKEAKEHHLVWLYHTGDCPAYLDHINGLRDDNRLENLRLSSHQNNMRNRAGNKNSSSKYKGVSRYKNNRWQVHIDNKYLGIFDCEEKAALAYDEKAKERHGEYARLNFG